MREASERLDRPCALLYRPSMLKFKCSDQRFCVVSVSKHHRTFLNREIITLLTSLQAKRQNKGWNPAAAVMGRQEQVLRQVAKMFINNDTAMTQLQVCFHATILLSLSLSLSLSHVHTRAMDFTLA